MEVTFNLAKEVISTLKDIRNELCNEDMWNDRYYNALTFCINLLSESEDN